MNLEQVRIMLEFASIIFLAGGGWRSLKDLRAQMTKQWAIVDRVTRESEVRHRKMIMVLTLLAMQGGEADKKLILESIRELAEGSGVVAVTE